MVAWCPATARTGRATNRWSAGATADLACVGPWPARTLESTSSRNNAGQPNRCGFGAWIRLCDPGTAEAAARFSNSRFKHSRATPLPLDRSGAGDALGSAELSDRSNDRKLAPRAARYQAPPGGPQALFGRTNSARIDRRSPELRKATCGQEPTPRGRPFQNGIPASVRDPALQVHQFGQVPRQQTQTDRLHGYGERNAPPVSPRQPAAGLSSGATSNHHAKGARLSQIRGRITIRP